MTMSFVGDIVIHEKANLYGEILLNGNIYIGEGVVLDNVTIYGDFNITCENRLTNITDSVINGHGNLKDCGVHDCFLVINGDCENFILDGLSVHEPRTFNDVLMDADEMINEPLEKQNDISKTIIVIEE